MSGSSLEGKRLRLRPVERTDVPRLFEWYSDPMLMSLYDGIQFATEDIESFKEQYLFWMEHDMEWGLAGTFIMEERESARPIGECSWMLVERTGPESPGIFQVGGLIGPADLRGQGYGTEALQLLRDYLFRELEAHRLEAMTNAFNSGAMKTLHRNGFVREGVLRQAVLINEVWQDRVLFSLLRHDWEQGALPSKEVSHE